VCAAQGVRSPGEGDAFVGADGRRPCVVLANGFGATVDCGLEPYVERFAAAGLDALAFDYRHFGASDGQPRQLLSIQRQLQDYAAAIAFARSLDGVDPDRIVVWGSSYSGGHVVPVAVSDGRVAAVIAQIPAMDGLASLINAARYAGPVHLAKLTLAGLRDPRRQPARQAAGDARGRGASGQRRRHDHSRLRAGLQGNRGPSWRNEVAARIALTAGAYRPGLQAERLPCPMLVQIADRDGVAPPKAAQDAAWRATGRGEVRTYPIGHFDIYTGEPFERAVADQLHFLRRHAGASQDRRMREAQLPGELAS